MTTLVLIVFVSFFQTSCGDKSSISVNPIIGSVIKIGNLEIAQYDFPEKMSWHSGGTACINLGKGWRLPTKDELALLFEYRDSVGNFGDFSYWSSTEIDDFRAYSMNFNVGNEKSSFTPSSFSVRAVRQKSKKNF